jgi:hypothetical protein
MDSKLPWTWKVLMGMTLDDAKTEFGNLLQAHALFEGANGRPGPFPIPLEVHPVDAVEAKGRAVPLARAWSDRRLWDSPAAFHGHLLAILHLAKAHAPKGEVDAFLDAREREPEAEKRRWLESHEIPTAGLDPAGLENLHESAQLTDFLLSRMPLGQVVVLEGGPARNNLSYSRTEDFGPPLPLDIAKARKTGFPEHEFRRKVSEKFPHYDAVLRALLAAYGRAYKPPALEDYRRINPSFWSDEEANFAAYRQAASARNGKAFARVFFAASRQLGEAYGFLASIGAHFHQSLHAKDLIGGQPTDFLDMGVPGREASEFVPVAAKGPFWLRAVTEPSGLYEALYGADKNAPDVRALGRRLFGEAARAAFRRGVERLVLGDAAEGLLSRAYRASLWAWLEGQASRALEAVPGSEDEAGFNALFAPIVREIKEGR